LAVLKLEKIARDFSDGRQVRRVLFPTDMEFAPGALTVLSGPSGSGKPPLLSVMGLVLRPSEGSLYWKGRGYDALGRRRCHAPLQTYGLSFAANADRGPERMENIALAFASRVPVYLLISAARGGCCVPRLEGLPTCSQGLYPVV
jgi:ABC-type transporter Mla maintaining outer membrane lipid asymmetry ATPase subunit MlaF